MIAWTVKNLVWIWPAFLASWVVVFGVLETIAMLNKGLTLSMWTWHLSEEWPLFTFLCGLVAGGLAVHFWWHWAPPDSIQLGLTPPPNIG